MPKVKGFVTSYAQEAGLDAQDAHARAQTGNNGAEPGREFKVRKDPNNYRMHPDNNRRMIKRSLRDLGAGRSIVVDNTGASIGGSGVLGEAEALGLPQRIVETDGSELVVVVRKDMGPDDPRRKLLALADNATTDQSEWDVEALQAAFDTEELREWEIDLPALDDVANDAASAGSAEAHGRLADKFLIPPFSVLDTRRGDWQNRKRAWNELIGDNGESREGKLGTEPITGNEKYGKAGFATVSILDATLAEIVTKWFTPVGKCNICDPFAGDSVFGFVSAYLGHCFTGIELREEQAALNNSRVQGMDAHYICDDGQNIGKHLRPESQDLVFSCPPYFDLEHYSDLPNDASNQKEYAGFLQILDNALTGAVQCLKKNRFAVIVMSNVRGGAGAYYDICSDITRIMQRNGLLLYNELVLLNCCGTAQIRAANYMRNRKIIRIHQEVLVFYKGNPKAIQGDFAEIEVADIEGVDDESADI